MPISGVDIVQLNDEILACTLFEVEHGLHDENCAVENGKNKNQNEVMMSFNFLQN